MDFHYCVLKKYSGLFRKKHLGNSHFFISPVSSNEFFFLGLIGEFIKVKSLYACILIARAPLEHMSLVVDDQIKHFKGRFEVVEKLSCDPKDLGQGRYKIKILSKGKYVKSDLAISFEPEYSDSNDRMYSVAGNIDIYVEEQVTPQTAKMLVLKKMAFLGQRAKFKIGG